MAQGSGFRANKFQVVKLISAILLLQFRRTLSMLKARNQLLLLEKIKILA